MAFFLRSLRLTCSTVNLKVNSINAKSLIGIRTPHEPERKRAHSKLAFFAPAQSCILIWWHGMGNLRVGRSRGGSSNPCRAITREFELSFDGLKKPLTRGHYHV